MEKYNLWGTPKIYMGHILFKILIADLFLVIDNIDLACYTDDDTNYCSNDYVYNFIA